MSSIMPSHRAVDISLSKAVSQPGSTPHRTHFLSLNFDVLALVIDALSRSSYWSPNDTYFRGQSSIRPLLPLSQTCRAMRETLLRRIFYTVRWPRKRSRASKPVAYTVNALASLVALMDIGSTGNLDTAVPEGILQHIRRLMISSEHTDVLLSYLRKMNSLSHITFDVKYTPSEEVVNTIARLPSLTAWDFHQTPLNFRLYSFVIPSLRRLSIIGAAHAIRLNGGRKANFATARSSLNDIPDIADIVFRMSAAQHNHAAYLTTSTSLLSANLELLQHLEADSSLFPWDLLGMVEWPNLRILVFYGDPPVDLDVPIMTLLKGMPSLEDLRLCWSPSGRNRSFEAIPRNLLDFESGRTLASSFPSLHSFTLSNPLPQDLIFSLLPHTVDHVYFPAIHRPNMMVTVSSDKALDIVRAIKRRKHTILSLQLTVEDMPSLSLVQSIASSFPNLQNLELGTISGLQGVFPETEGNFDAYGDAIAPLVHLQTLRITLPFQNNFRSDMFIADQTEKQFAESLASRFPKLYQVAFQSIHCTGPRGGGERFNAWERYDIIRGGSSNATVAVWDDPSK